MEKHTPLNEFIRKRRKPLKMTQVEMSEKSIENVFNKLEQLLNVWHEFIKESFLKEAFKEAYHEMIEAKFKQIELK